MLELAKCLKLVAPITMSADAQKVWLQAAVDALDGIHASEVAAISHELRRTVTRPSQIVPEIAKLVHEKRQRANRSTKEISPFAAAFAINEEAQKRRGAAKTQEQIEDAWAWERHARIAAGLHVEPLQPPLTADELEHMPKEVIELGISRGFLKRENGRLVETKG